LCRLNSLIPEIADKFQLLKASKTRVTECLSKYLHNLEEIQQCLGEFESQILAQKSHKAELQAEVAKVNAMIKNILNLGVSNQPTGFDCFRKSAVLTPEHKEKLIEWYGSGWALLYSAKRDGWSSRKFHKKCDYKGATIVVISHSQGQFVIGGFAAQSWTSENRYITNNQCSFLQ
jgi:hypothetical protein